MNNIIERYVYDVTRRLPEKEREDVSKELKSNIYDMLPENANDDIIKEVLYELGDPAKLAEEYRQNPRYLIPPAMYDEYIRTLKWLVPLVGIVLLVVGIFSGVFTVMAAGDGVANLKDLFRETISKGISFSASGLFQVVVWTTVGFVVAERTGTKETPDKNEEWKLEDLPEIQKNDKGTIPLSDIIIGAVLSAVFTVISVLVCSGIMPIKMGFYYNGTAIEEVFSSSFLSTCIPVFIIIGVFALIEYACKFIYRRWTPVVCVSVIISDIVSTGAFIYLVTRSSIFSQSFMNFVRNNEWGSHDVMQFIGKESNNPVLLIIIVIAVVIAVISCGHALYKTMQENKA
ncbi:MAG: HAAS signaling domain-containing protein [Coprobacillaceae bacterium]